MITHRHLQTLGDQITTRLSSAFATRAVELAEEAHLTGTPHLVEIRQHTVLFRVPSKDRTREYCTVADRTGSVWCECAVSSQFDHACCHAGATIHYMRQLAKLVDGYSY